MITIKLLCPYCQNENIVRNGRTLKGKQKYLCRSCGRQSQLGPQQNRYSQAKREEILRAYREGSSLRGISRIFGVSRNTVTSWVKQEDVVQNEG